MNFKWRYNKEEREYYLELDDFNWLIVEKYGKVWSIQLIHWVSGNAVNPATLGYFQYLSDAKLFGNQIKTAHKARYPATPLFEF